MANLRFAQGMLALAKTYGTLPPTMPARWPWKPPPPNTLRAPQTGTESPTAIQRSSDGQATAWGARDLTEDESSTSFARFDDGGPAITRRQIGNGAIIHFSWLPGISYMKSATTTSSRLPSGFSAVIRNWIVSPALEAGVSPPVHASVAMVETPVLVSPAGAAVTLLNWNNEPIPKLILDLRLNFRVHAVRSVKVGPLPFKPTSTGIHVSLSLGAADILVVKP